MTALVQQIVQRAPSAVADAARFAFRVVVLAVALVAYGSVPSTAVVQSEYESQLQEEAAGTTATLDLRSKLHGAALRRAQLVVPAALSQFAVRTRQARLGDMLGPQVSLGLSLPLRC
jgi:hypothetical protein